MTIFLVRHGRAGDRSKWQGPDDLRPLSKVGRRQALGLLAFLETTPIDRVVSSPYVRCRQSVEPLAEQRRLPVDLAEELTEGAPLAAALRLVDKVTHEHAVLCTHGDVITELLSHFERQDIALGKSVKLEKGSVWEMDVDEGRVVSARYHPPPG